MSQVHFLKIKSEYFEAVVDGSKRFEVRFNDRGFNAGDILFLEDINTGRTAVCPVHYILREFPGLVAGYVVMSISFCRFLGDVS